MDRILPRRNFFCGVFGYKQVLALIHSTVNITVPRKKTKKIHIYNVCCEVLPQTNPIKRPSNYIFRLFLELNCIHTEIRHMAQSSPNTVALLNSYAINKEEEKQKGIRQNVFPCHVKQLGPNYFLIQNITG